MTEEQINEAMRLGELWATYAWKACSHGADETVKSQAGRAALEAYLSTIGEPENTFPLNPNGASKWAHLQKHDGADAIGVVFRTGSGSVGSLVDGRVVWADWLAHPNGSKPESVNAELLEALKYARRFMNKSAHDTDYLDAAIARAESAIETPAKVSPCAGHATQLPDPLGLLSCTHPDCGRYEGPRSHECRAMADNACARPSICQGHAAQQEADDLVGLRGCNSRHGGMRAVEPCGYRMRTTDPSCTGCAERDEDRCDKAARRVRIEWNIGGTSGHGKWFDRSNRSALMVQCLEMSIKHGVGSHRIVDEDQSGEAGYEND